MLSKGGLFSASDFYNHKKKLSIYFEANFRKYLRDVLMVVIKLCVVSTLFCTAWLMVIIALFDKVKITSGNV